MRRSTWLALALAPYGAFLSAALIVGIRLDNESRAFPVEGKFVLGAFMYLCIALASMSAITATIAAIRWRRTIQTDPAESRAYRNFSLGAAVGAVLLLAFGPVFGLRLAALVSAFA
jgi:hypothetical protein